MPIQSECESSRLGEFSPSNSSQRPQNSLDAASTSSPPTRSESIASSCIQENSEYKPSQYPSPPKPGHLQSTPYFPDDSTSYRAPLSGSHSPLGMQSYLVSAFDETCSPSAHNAALHRPRPLEPRTWGSAHDLAPGASESPLVYGTQPTLQPPDDLAMWSYAPNSTSTSFELATNPLPALLCQAHSNLSRPLSQIQTSYVDSSSLFLNPDPSSIATQQHLRTPPFADNDWQFAYHRISASHPPRFRSNATPPMQPTLVHAPWFRPAFGFPIANPQPQVGAQQAPAARRTQFVPYVAPPHASSAATPPTPTRSSTPDQNWALGG